MSEEEYFTYANGSHAAFSNLFRYALLSERGGWWVDTDVVCLASEIPVFDKFYAWEDGDIINGAVLRFERGDTTMRRCLEIGRERARQGGNDLEFGALGVHLITSVLVESGLESEAHSSTVCYPIHYEEFLELFAPASKEMVTERCNQSLFVHLWNEMWRLNEISKFMCPPRGSFLRDLSDRLQIDGWDGEHSWMSLKHLIEVQGERRWLKRELQEVQNKLTAAVSIRQG